MEPNPPGLGVRTQWSPKAAPRQHYLGKLLKNTAPWAPTGRFLVSGAQEHAFKVLSSGVGAWVAQLVKRLTLGFSSGHDLTMWEFEPRLRVRADSMEPAWGSVSLLCALSPLPHIHFLSLSLKINKL